MKSNMKKTFSLVELIIVVTIIAILTGVATVNISKWLKDSRDTKRAGDLNNTMSAMATYISANDAYPLPDNYKVLQYATGIVGYQGEIAAGVAKNIGLKYDPVDPKTDEYYSLALDKDRIKFQILATLENPNKEFVWYMQQVFAQSATSLLISKGDAIWILLNNNNTKPLEKVLSGNTLTLNTYTGETLIYFKDNSYVVTSWTKLWMYLNIYRKNIGFADLQNYLNLTIDNWNGNIEYDSSRYNNNAIIGSNTKRTDGVLGKSLWFQGKTASQSTLFNPGLPWVQPLTVSAWINPISISGSTVTIVDNAAWNYWFKLNSDLWIRAFWITSSTAKISLNKWTHIVTVCNWTTLYLYIDGQRSQTSTCSVATPNIVIGDNNYNGYIDEIKVFSSALNDEEVGLLYKAVK